MNFDDIIAELIDNPDDAISIGGREVSENSGKTILEVQEMNIGDMFRRWDGLEFVKLANNRIENMETGETEFCERNCKGEIIGNLLGNYGPTLKQENRRYAIGKVEKVWGSPKKERIQTIPKSWITIDGIDIPVEKCFSRKER